MSAFKVYNFSYIAPGATVGVYVHGYPANMAMVYSMTPYILDSGTAYTPIAAATLTQGYTQNHVDGTWARTAYVQSNASFNDISADLNAVYDFV
jgi:hypothetical protein